MTIERDDAIRVNSDSPVSALAFIEALTNTHAGTWTIKGEEPQPDGTTVYLIVPALIEQQTKGR